MFLALDTIIAEIQCTLTKYENSIELMSVIYFLSDIAYMY